MSEFKLIEAVKAENVDRAKVLINSEININQQDEHGWTPLNWAAGKGHIDLVKLLVKSGADIFRVGQDIRTPYDIALAAGRVDVVMFLREAEKAAGIVNPNRPERKYAKAYLLESLRCFSDWMKINRQSDQSVLLNDDIVFIHQDFTVTKSIRHNEDVIFDSVTSEWREYCTDKLGFRVPDDLDLISR